jgi:hypothetical protein
MQLNEAQQTTCTWCCLQLGNNRVPPWAVKWAALALQFTELERQVLPAELLGLPPPHNFYSPEYAQAQATVRVVYCFLDAFLN